MEVGSASQGGVQQQLQVSMLKEQLNNQAEVAKSLLEPVGQAELGSAKSPEVAGLGQKVDLMA